ncbi:hypothetical protein BSZ21_02945 [Bradyrhizobium canariense]|nr:hypothetical protein BSZ21_02945 [Bradyrhizobium canariense]
MTFVLAEDEDQSMQHVRHRKARSAGSVREAETRERVEIRRASLEIAIGILLHRTVVVAECESTESTSSAMIETLGAK